MIAGVGFDATARLGRLRSDAGHEFNTAALLSALSMVGAVRSLASIPAVRHLGVDMRRIAVNVLAAVATGRTRMRAASGGIPDRRRIVVISLAFAQQEHIFMRLRRAI